MEMVYFTIAAVVLYLVSDWILNQVEIRRGERFENRTLIFFGIIVTLSFLSFQLIQTVYKTPVAEQSVENTSDQPAAAENSSGASQ